jgi:hypothetical protein
MDIAGTAEHPGFFAIGYRPVIFLRLRSVVVRQRNVIEFDRLQDQM